MKPGQFEYHGAASKEAALSLKRQYGPEGAFLAGGQSLMPLMNMRLAQPAALIDLNRATELDHVTVADSAIKIGALTRAAAAERSEEINTHCPVVAEALKHVGHQVIRNRGTIGGSIAHADPAAELPAVLVAMRSLVVVESVDGERTVPAEDFFQFHFTTALAPEEMVTAVTVPMPPPDTGYAFLEVSRRHGDFAIAAVCALVGDGTTRLVYAGVAPRPLVVETDDDDPADAAVQAAEQAGIMSDLSGSRDYRRRLVAVLARRGREAASQRVGGRDD